MRRVRLRQRGAIDAGGRLRPTRGDCARCDTGRRCHSITHRIIRERRGLGGTSIASVHATMSARRASIDWQSASRPRRRCRGGPQLLGYLVGTVEWENRLGARVRWQGVQRRPRCVQPGAIHDTKQRVSGKKNGGSTGGRTVVAVKHAHACASSCLCVRG